MPSRVDITTSIATYEATRRKGVDFLLASIAPTGEIADSGRPRVSYYRLPWALQVSGETAAAARVLDWLARERLGPDGRFNAAVPWDPAANATTNSYPETILAYGAWLLRRFHIANQAMTFASQFQDPETGGVFMTREESGEHGRQLLFVTSQFGMSAAIIGRVAEAIKAAEWLERVWDAQPDLPHRLFTIWTRGAGLATEVPPGENPGHYVNDARETFQYHYNGGIAAACLTHVYMLTGDARWIELARKYQRFSMESTEGQFLTKQVCKSAWGSGLISLATGDAGYEAWLIKMGDWFTAEQEVDGRWSNTKRLDPNPPLAHQIEATAEFVVHLDTLIAALAAIASRR